MRLLNRLLRTALLGIMLMTLLPSTSAQAACADRWPGCDDPNVHFAAEYVCESSSYTLCYFEVDEMEGCWAPAGVICGGNPQTCNDLDAE